MFCCWLIWSRGGGGGWVGGGAVCVCPVGNTDRVYYFSLSVFGQGVKLRGGGGGGGGGRIVGPATVQ